MDFTNDDIASLGDKLAALDLTDGEREALRTIVALANDADDDEVSGFARVVTEEITFKADFGSLGLKVGPPRRSIVAMGDGEEI